MNEVDSEHITLCSNCFKDEGLILESIKIGSTLETICPQCKTYNGHKLSKSQIYDLAHSFFVRGTWHRTDYGGAPVIQFNEYHYQKNSIDNSEWLNEDITLICEVAQIGLFYYGPRLWMVGENEPLKKLQEHATRQFAIEELLSIYPEKIVSINESFYRLRKNPKRTDVNDEYDSPPSGVLGNGRLESNNLSILYGSKDLESCIHECRVTVEDELYFATMKPKKDLKLLDLTADIREDKTEFESINIAVSFLFSAGNHSYDICRDIAIAAKAVGYDGILYNSYFSYFRGEDNPNIALFGRPIEENKIKVTCINRLLLNKITYSFSFGPAKY